MGFNPLLLSIKIHTTLFIIPQFIVIDNNKRHTHALFRPLA